MLKFKRDPNAGHPAYAVELGELPLARIEQRDDWELPRRPRWSLDLPADATGRAHVTLWFDTLADAKEGVCELLRSALRSVVRNPDIGYVDLKRMAGAHHR